VRQDRRPYFLAKLTLDLERAYARHFLVPAFDAIGPGLNVARPWAVTLWGHNITAGRDLHLRASREAPISLATWVTGERHGHISLGDYVLLSPGVQIISSDRIDIGSNTMFASGCYISDSDWHDTYDRTAEREKHAPVRIGENCWLGVRVIVGKGVSIGDNSIVGAGSVVSHDIPANTIAAGNPARVIRELDPERAFKKREDLLGDRTALQEEMDRLNRYLLKDNSFWNWGRARTFPRRGD